MPDTIDKRAEELASLLEYDSISGVIRWRVNRGGGIKAGRPAGAFHNGYLRISVLGKCYYAHRVAWLLFYGRWPMKQIDHIDGNRSNNKINNLREVSNRINNQNKAIHKAGRLPGVKKLGNRWVANIQIGKKNIHLGMFGTEKQAHQTYMSASALLED